MATLAVVSFHSFYFAVPAATKSILGGRTSERTACCAQALALRKALSEYNRIMLRSCGEPDFGGAQDGISQASRRQWELAARVTCPRV